MSGGHQSVNPPELPRAVGFAHAVVAVEGRTVHLAGQVAVGANGEIRGRTMAEQFEVAAGNLVTALAAAGGEPEHVVSLQVFVTDMSAYRASLVEIGASWRRHFGRWYPAMALIGVTELLVPEAMVEILGVAVIPKPATGI